MKNTIKKSLLLALLYYTIALVGCVKNQCQCPAVKDGFFRFTELKLQNLQYSFIGDTSYSSSYNSTDTIPKNSYGIALNFTSELVAKIERKQSFSFINTAFACDCVTPNYSLKDSLQTIKIFCTKDFDAAHPVGSDITEHFVFVGNDYNTNKITQSPLSSGYYNFSNQYDPKRAAEQTIYLNIAPESSREVQFEVKMIFKSGRELSATSTSVFLK